MAVDLTDKNRNDVFVRSIRIPAGRIQWHTHQRAQFKYVSEGTLTVHTEQDTWVIPPQRAVWILPQVRHCAESTRPYSLCSLYVKPGLVSLPPGSGVVAVEPLLRELLLAAAEIGPTYEPHSTEERLIRVILDLLPVRPLKTLHLSDPHDKRLKFITEGLKKEPANSRPLSDWAKLAGLTARNAERLFHRELGMTFGEWRKQVRLLNAMEQLGSGKSVSEVAGEIGYRDVSSFIATFKSTMGTTPAKYFRQNQS